MTKDIINEEAIQDILEQTKNPSKETILNILKKSKGKKGLELEEVGCLVNLNNPNLEQELFQIASWIKNEVYGERLVFFAPLYISDFCVNDCAYCNFHIRNQEFRRKKLTLEEIEEQVKVLINMGHKRILLECGEDSNNNDIDYVIKVIDKIYSVKTEKGNMPNVETTSEKLRHAEALPKKSTSIGIRRINVNIAATNVENYRKLKQAHIGTYQLFQETYHRRTYEKLHKGPKADYDRQVTAHIKAFAAGLDDLGLGVLFGLYDWRFEVLALISHAKYLEAKFGVGPHTISIPRFRPAQTVTYNSEYPVSDSDFLKLIAILRLAVPYTGMIISTRERPEIRRQAFKIGISQASAASVTTTGGYGSEVKSQSQFEIQDERKLFKVIESILEDGLLPSFCTACYRVGRTGEKFMGFAKPGEIHNFCRPNGILTFAEYLEDFAVDGIYDKGYKIINFYLNRIEDEEIKVRTKERLEKIKQGERDIYF